MSTKPPTVISENNLSVAWAKAFLEAMSRSGGELAPLNVSIGGFSGAPIEDGGIRKLLDTAILGIRKKKVFSCDVSASTIFPWKYWKMNGSPGCDKFSKQYLADILPRLLARDPHHNKYGTYFGRMVDFGASPKEAGRGKNQLKHIVEMWHRYGKSGNHPRHSAMVAACFDPLKDHGFQPMRGFPCLQQVSFGYDAAGGLSVSAYYPTQYIFDRAYGNYLGLGHLGQFMASQLGVKLVRINVFVGRPELGSPGKRELKSVAAAVAKRLEQLV